MLYTVSFEFPWYSFYSNFWSKHHGVVLYVRQRVEVPKWLFMGRYMDWLLGFQRLYKIERNSFTRSRVLVQLILRLSVGLSLRIHIAGMGEPKGPLPGRSNLVLWSCMVRSVTPVKPSASFVKSESLQFILY